MKNDLWYGHVLRAAAGQPAARYRPPQPPQWPEESAISAVGIHAVDNGDVPVNAFGTCSLPDSSNKPALTSCREALRSATQAPHERLHLHAGFSAVKDGTITLLAYRALLIRLYGFYLPFERAIAADDSRTRWLEEDLAWLGVDAAALSVTSSYADIPQFDSAERRLGALYVVEGAALGGRLLCRGLDRLLGVDSHAGRRFFAGRGAATGTAWLGFLERLTYVGQDPTGRAALVGAAIETFDVFENWLRDWNENK